MSAELKIPNELRFARYHELQSGESLEWLWDGFIAAGNITLLTSQWKAGKTTLVSALLHQMKAGGELGGRGVRPGSAGVISEENESLWQERGRPFDYAANVRFLCRPFQGKPSHREFLGLVDAVLAQHAEDRLNLVVIDSLAKFLPPGCENSADAIIEFLGTLQKFTDENIAVLILHHPSKKRGGEGRAARGSGALGGGVDILIEMNWVCKPSAGDRRRLLKAWSRHRQTPPRWVIELNKAGTEYAAAELPAKKAFLDDDIRPALRAVLSDAPGKLTLAEIHERWPACDRCPQENLLWRWLKRGVRAKIILRDGAGHRHNPHRYWLPEREQEWNANPLIRMAMENFERWKRERGGQNTTIENSAGVC